MTYFDGGLGTKFLLHYSLYTKSLLFFQNNDFHKEMLRKVKALEDIGVFMLTEFHHGSYSKGMESKAYYNH